MRPSPACLIFCRILTHLTQIIQCDAPQIKITVSRYVARSEEEQVVSTATKDFGKLRKMLLLADIS
jgi:hypothetical protein